MKDHYMKKQGLIEENAFLKQKIQKLEQSESERKQMEDMLRENRESLDLALRSADMGVWRWDIIENKRYFDDHACHLLGINPATFTGTAEAFFEVVHPDDRESIKARLDRAIEQDVQYELEYHVVWPDGSIHYITSRGRLVHDDKDRPLRFNGILWDITERKLAEEAIIVAKNDWENTFNAVTDIITVHDMDFNIVRANPAAMTILGLQPHTEIPLAKCFKCYHGTEKPPSVCASCRSLKTEEPSTIEIFEPYLNKHLEIRAMPRFGNNGQLVGLIHVAMDITERKQAEEALHAGRLQLKAILDNIPDIAWLKDKECRFIAVNEPFGKSCGFKPEDLVGKTDLDIWPRDLAERYRADDKEVMESGKRKQVEEPLKDTEGRILWIETIKTPIYDEHGDVSGTAGIARDITERKLVEQKLQQTLDSLRKSFGTIIQVMVSTVETRDPYTSGHQVRSANIARAIATEMGLLQEKIDGIRMAASIHDIGKLSIPVEILSKPGKLSAIEFSLIKGHPRSGYEILKDIESPWPLAEVIYQHHERMNGSGYPRNLKGDEILMEARIMAVADVVESMASHRPYRPALGINAALEEIEKNKGKLYDTDVADVCLRLFREKGFQIDGA